MNGAFFCHGEILHKVFAVSGGFGKRVLALTLILADSAQFPCYSLTTVWIYTQWANDCAIWPNEMYQM